MNCPNASWNWSKKTKTLPRRITTFTTNWLAKLSLSTLTLLVLALMSCEAPKEIGLPPEVIADVKFVDTLTVRTSTVLLDSVRTSNAQRILVGAYNDPIFGKVKAQSFVEFTSTLNLNLNADGTTNTNVYAFDSVSISLSYNYYYGDTLKPFQMAVHRLTDTLLTGKMYYNNSTVPYSSTPLASHTFYPTPRTSSLVTMRLPDAFGQEIFALNGKPEASTIAKFTQTIKGLTFVPAATNASVIGISPQSTGITLNLFYHNTADTIALVKTFFINKRFNHVEADRQGTALSKIQPLKPLAASETGGLNYIQDALGIVTKLEIPYLQELFKQKGIAINRAELLITPTWPEGTNSIYTLPIGLALAETDASNRLLRTKGDTELLVPNDATTFQSYILPQVVVYSTKTRNYNFILTTYLQALAVGFKKNPGLLLMPISGAPEVQSYSTSGQPLSSYYPFMNNKLDRLTITPNKENIKLMLFYTTAQ